MVWHAPLPASCQNPHGSHMMSQPVVSMRGLSFAYQFLHYKVTGSFFACSALWVHVAWLSPSSIQWWDVQLCLLGSEYPPLNGQYASHVLYSFVLCLWVCRFFSYTPCGIPVVCDIFCFPIASLYADVVSRGVLGWPKQHDPSVAARSLCEHLCFPFSARRGCCPGLAAPRPPWSGCGVWPNVVTCLKTRQCCFPK